MGSNSAISAAPVGTIRLFGLNLDVSRRKGLWIQLDGFMVSCRRMPRDCPFQLIRRPRADCFRIKVCSVLSIAPPLLGVLCGDVALLFICAEFRSIDTTSVNLNAS